jgi:hypothetical protein
MFVGGRVRSRRRRVCPSMYSIAMNGWHSAVSPSAYATQTFG